jgi:hypothetical protein
MKGMLRRMKERKYDSKRDGRRRRHMEESAEREDRKNKQQERVKLSYKEGRNDR